MQYLAEQGFCKLNAGASRASLEGGALQYKKKWEARITPPGCGGFLLRIAKGSPGLTAFLQNNPFISCLNDALDGIIFGPEQCAITCDQNDRVKTKCGIPGLKDLEIYYLKESGEQHPVARLENLATMPADGIPGRLTELYE